MKVQNGWEIYKSKNIDWIGVGRNQNVRDLKKMSIEKMWEFITESGLLENIYYNELSKWLRNLSIKKYWLNRCRKTPECWRF